MPVVELYKRASALAEAALCTKKNEDLELAFGGEARGAFLWLQCFISEEEDWCQTIGCPACTTTTTLSTESHIRLTIAAALLSTASLSSPTSSPAPSSTSSAASSPLLEDPPSIDELNAPSLPPLPHILPALREAMSADPFWGPDYWSFIFARANQLSAGIQMLIAECTALESLVSSPTTARPTTRPSSQHTFTTPAAFQPTSISSVLRPIREEQEERGLKLKKSKLAKRQLRLQGEEIEFLKRCAMQCWARAVVPRGLRSELEPQRSRRNRSLTCP
ncbi:hypothetical protein CC78DRAFT_47074 [Lojkania enalia]|uniref:Uncharacterized protein n=1 Tax=Lojkania enalia TaxID=147567 RepID=A0A9P4KGJ9_9PLEO|nr:hypothetical protein CC78DRAFT_47074 [Didymosphaeria enalia]